MDKEKLKENLREYRRKIESGEIDPPERLNPIERAKKNPKSKALAIKAKCWECSSGQTGEITNCAVYGCPLFLLRPYQKKEITNEI